MAPLRFRVVHGYRMAGSGPAILFIHGISDNGRQRRSRQGRTSFVTRRGGPGSEFVMPLVTSLPVRGLIRALLPLAQRILDVGLDVDYVWGRKSSAKAAGQNQK
jgi:hypothetical protein